MSKVDTLLHIKRIERVEEVLDRVGMKHWPCSAVQKALGVPLPGVKDHDFDAAVAAVAVAATRYRKRGATR